MAWTPTQEIINHSNLIHEILLSYGYSKESSAGVIANLIVETGYTLDPKINETGGGGYGLGQWTPKENVYIQGSQLGLSRAECDTIEGQAKIIAQGDVTGQWMNYVNLSYPGNPRNPLDLNTFKKSNDKEQCTTDFMAHWERPSEIYHHWDWRIEAVIAIYPHLTGEGGTGTQLAVLPCWGTVYITQAEGDDFSHAGSLSVDFAYSTPKVPLYAPFDMVCKYVDTLNAFTVWQSINPVKCADGSVTHVTFNTGHSDDVASNKVGDTKKKGEVYAHTGTSGNVTGDHTHIECSKGKYTGPWYQNPAGKGSLPNPAHMYEVFSSCNNVTKEKINIINQSATPMPFVCVLNWDDGSNSTPNPQPKEDDFVDLLLVDALNGWKW